MLNKNGESGYPCLIPDLKGITFSFSLLSIILAVGLSYMAFVMLSHVLSISTLLRGFFFFYHKGVLDIVKCFSISIDMIIWFLFYFVYVVYHINWFADFGWLFLRGSGSWRGVAKFALHITRVCYKARAWVRLGKNPFQEIMVALTLRVGWGGMGECLLGRRSQGSWV